jgi:hypothetical protein
MKTLVLLTAFVLLPLALCQAQLDPEVVELRAAVEPKLNDIDALMTAANALLAKNFDAPISGVATEKTLSTISQSIQDNTKAVTQLSAAIGDPSKPVDTAGYDNLKQRIQDWIDKGGLGDTPGFDNIPPDKSTDGNQAFGITGGGLLGTAVSNKFQDPTNPTQSDGKTAIMDNRDPSLYVNSVAELASVAQYYTVRQAAMDRRSQLQTLLKDTINAIETSTDLATTFKEYALVTSVEAQLKVVNDDLNTSFDDAAIRALQATAYGQILQNSQNEVTQKAMANKTSSATSLKSAGVSGGSGSGAGSASSISSIGFTTGRLPWKPFTF